MRLKTARRFRSLYRVPCMAEDLFITALVYFSASLVVALLAGRFMSLQDENIEYDAIDLADLGEEEGRPKSAASKSRSPSWMGGDPCVFAGPDVLPKPALPARAETKPGASEPA